MKKILLLVLVVGIALIAVNRQRIYVRDPLATVIKNDAKQSGVEVYVNVSDDVLLWREAEPRESRILVQGWNKVPGTPERLTCLRWMVCVTDADRASIIPLDWNSYGTSRGKYDPVVTMTGREVTYMDADGATIRVELR
ncbi:MAG: hypothetical protein ACLQM6_04455 [Acidobacteriaceae bacterium]